MLTSEEEAKEKWCPQTRLMIFKNVEGRLLEGSSVCNRQYISGQERTLVPQSAMCLGSECMFWRWQGWKTIGHISIAQDPKEENRDGPRLGYCGLAGEPSPYGPR